MAGMMGVSQITRGVINGGGDTGGAGLKPGDNVSQAPVPGTYPVGIIGRIGGLGPTRARQAGQAPELPPFPDPAQAPQLPANPGLAPTPVGPVAFPHLWRQPGGTVSLPHPGAGGVAGGLALNDHAARFAQFQALMQQLGRGP